MANEFEACHVIHNLDLITYDVISYKVKNDDVTGLIEQRRKYRKIH